MAKKKDKEKERIYPRRETREQRHERWGVSDYKPVAPTQDDWDDANEAECVKCGRIGMVPHVFVRGDSKMVMLVCLECYWEGEM